MHRYISVIVCLLLCTRAFAQDEQLTQTVRGVITDAESKTPMPGVVVVLVSNQQINAVTDSNGYFSLAGVPVGRQSFFFTIAGYDNHTESNVMVTSGKELELNVSLTEGLHQLKEVSVKAVKDRSRALNDFATLSARSFSVEDTKRFAASVSDPARMAMNFAGVSNNGDLENDIVVRGNSPKGVLWRLEGIEIPNPNHFNDFGNSGGSISMLNANTLGNSDFYTGAFPPEIGDALSGAFDLYLRNGNKDRYEHTVQVGVLGTEVATEGPFRKGGSSSYLIDYRYSTLALLQNYLNLQGIEPNYQDMSFKFNFPTRKAGTFALFGLGGYNKAIKDPPQDSTQWNDDDPNFRLKGNGMMGTAGITHQVFLNSHAYVRTVFAGSYDQIKRDVDTLNTEAAYAPEPVEHAHFANTGWRLSSFYNNKINNKNTIRTGIVLHELGYDLDDNMYDYGRKQWRDILTGSGQTQYYQAYVQWKKRFSDRWSMVTGANASYYALNGKYALEPRAAITYQMAKSKLSIAAGLHSKPDHISTYLYRDTVSSNSYPNKSLDLQRAFHIVAGYDVALPLKARLKAELYYQHLYNIGVSKDSNSGFSVLNAESMLDLANSGLLTSAGTGTNYGVDLTIERPFVDNYYVLFTGSLFKSTYTTVTGASYEGHFDRRYQLNIVGGKEFNFGRKGRSIFGANAKVLYSGGQRESPIDLSASQAAGKTIYVPNQYFTTQSKPYFRTDASLYYKLNNKRATHTIELDVQDVTNYINYWYSYYDVRSSQVKHVNESGIIPVISYRIDFHW